MAELDGKVALVTGAGQGIGVGISLALAKAGASVGLVGRTRSKLEDTAAKIAAIGGRTHVCQGDVTDRESVNAFVAEIQDVFGPIWLLVNNAVSAQDQSVEEVEDDNLDLALRSGVYGSLYTMQACFPTMKEHGGRIVNFGSGGATMGIEYNAAYNIAKEGIRALTKTAATGWGKYGITVNTVCPIASTPLYDRWWDSITEEQQRAHMEAIPMRRMGDPEKDVGALIVFLAGPGSSYITSRTLHIDGGRAFYDR
ncbi:MAG: SDR family NAD(P)-dependent oxidoreductase [Novosphingobium sp.]|nr:SDR family oxidoreductase [Novosphingobium sp.]